jgi:two-component system NtrC family response regulator
MATGTKGVCYERFDRRKGKPEAGERAERSMIEVLSVDDEVREAGGLKRQFAAHGIAVTSVSCAADALSLCKEKRFDAAILGVGSPDLDGGDLLEELKRREPTLEVIIYTNDGDVDSAVRCMKRGAYDYLTKPSEFQRLIDVVHRAAQEGRKEREFTLYGDSKTMPGSDNLIGESEGIRKVRDLVGLVAPSRAPVLILGETGTGKELVARAIHAQSPRRPTPLVAINSGALQETTLESELFGYKKGAFTGAQSDKQGLLDAADNGTCFIDEVGDMGLSIQAKILRVVESGVFIKLGDTRETSVDVRFLFATNRDLPSLVEQGSFRKDLFYRINACTLNLPSLKERGEDILLLANYFLRRFSQEERCLTRKAAELLVAYHWPGNVRELVNVIQRAILVSGTRRTIAWDDLPINIINAVVSNADQRKPASLVETSLAKRHGEYVAKIMDFTEGNKSKAARLLGISRNTLYRKLRLRSALG